MSLPLRGRAIIRGINPSARALTRLIPLETKHTHLLTYNPYTPSGDQPMGEQEMTLFTASTPARVP